MRKVQIDMDLFMLLCRYHLLEDDEPAETIARRLQDKLDALTRREQYTQYKTADSSEKRENARCKYLDAKGIPENFRW